MAITGTAPEVRPYVAGEWRDGVRTSPDLNPSKPSEHVGRLAQDLAPRGRRRRAPGGEGGVRRFHRFGGELGVAGVLERDLLARFRGVHIG